MIFQTILCFNVCTTEFSILDLKPECKSYVVCAALANNSMYICLFGQY